MPQNKSGEKGGSISGEGPKIGSESLWKVFCRKLFQIANSCDRPLHCLNEFHS